MPKMKTNRSAAKRIKKTANGKLKRSKSLHSHILTKKSPKRKRKLRQATMIEKSDEKKIRNLIPN